MKLSICTDVMADLAFTGMIDNCIALGIEMTGGGWSRGPHFRADALLEDKGKLKSALKEIEARGLEIAALASRWAPETSPARMACKPDSVTPLAGRRRPFL